jgi:hypothetical protein
MEYITYQNKNITENKKLEHKTIGSRFENRNIVENEKLEENTVGDPFLEIFVGMKKYKNILLRKIH